MLIFKDRNYEFDMRGILRCFYIVIHYFFALCCKLGVLIIDTSRVKVVSGGVNACLRKSTMPFYFKSWIKEGVRIYCIFLWKIVVGLLGLRDLFFLVSGF